MEKQLITVLRQIERRLEAIERKMVPAVKRKPTKAAKGKPRSTANASITVQSYL